MKVMHLIILNHIFVSLSWAGPIIGPEEDKLSNISNQFDAVCSIYVKGAFTCSGTVVKGNTLITAGHCLDNVHKEEISIRCGCHENSCIETFKADGTKFEYTEATSKTPLVDHGLIKLDHPPLHINPIEIDTNSEFFDQQTGALKANVSCITGGYSRNGKPAVADVSRSPNMYRLNDLKYRSEQKFYHSEVAHISYEQAQSCAYWISPSDEYIKLIEDLNKAGQLKGAALYRGDSGGPLLCKIKDGAYKLVAINSMYHAANINDPKGTDFYNIFSTFPKPEFHNPLDKFTPIQITPIDQLYVKPKPKYKKIIRAK